MAASTLLPAGLVLIGLVLGFVVGLTLGWLSQQGLDRVLQVLAACRAVVTRPVAVAAVSRPGMPFYRDPTGGGW